MSLLLLLALTSFSVEAKTVRYELTVTKEKVNLSGKKTVDFALAVNGQIPSPTLEFTEGDDAELVLHNRVPDEEVSVHWHGILLPPEMDGVPYINTPPIPPGASHTFRFKLRQHGTYWYHSHTATQEQKGVYGAFIVHPKKKTIAADREFVLVISDWTDENPDQVLRNLKKDGDYYIYKKKSVRSYWGALRSGGLKNQLHNEWMGMGGMDLSDVGYDAFLINGKREVDLGEAKPGERIRLRLINASSSSYFYVSLGGLPLQFISADGVDIEPIQAEEVLMGMAETYDVLFTVPERKRYEIRATAQDVTGYASAWIGRGESVPAQAKPMPDLYASMDHGAHAEHHEHEEHHDHHDHHDHASEPPAVETLTVKDLASPVSTLPPKAAPVRELEMVLGGDMERYVWFLDGKTMAEKRAIPVSENEVIRLTFKNDTMMHHPFHLHGHFFRVLNGKDERSPLKHTVDVPPHESVTIEFYTNEPGEWMLHCHNLYHMKSGMARVVSYATFRPSPEMLAHRMHDPHLHEHVYFAGSLQAATNVSELGLRLSRTRDSLEARVEAREHEHGIWDWEGDVFYRRWMRRGFNLFGGGSMFDDENRALIGVGYTLPLLIETNLSLDSEGDYRLDLERRFQWTSRVFSDLEMTFRQERKTEFNLSLMYADRWDWAAGLSWTEESLGLGFQYRF